MSLPPIHERQCLNEHGQHHQYSPHPHPPPHPYDDFSSLGRGRLVNAAAFYYGVPPQGFDGSAPSPGQPHHAPRLDTVATAAADGGARFQQGMSAVDAAGNDWLLDSAVVVPGFGIDPRSIQAAVPPHSGYPADATHVSPDVTRSMAFTSTIPGTRYQSRPPRRFAPSPPTSPSASSPPPPPPKRRPGRRRKSEANPDPFGTAAVGPPGSLAKSALERNRVAAAKCRSKRNAADAELALHQREMEDRNTELRADYGALRAEVLCLKAQLHYHADCDCDLIRQYLSNEARRYVQDGSGGGGDSLDDGGYGDGGEVPMG